MRVIRSHRRRRPMLPAVAGVVLVVVGGILASPGANVADYRSPPQIETFPRVPINPPKISAIVAIPEPEHPALPQVFGEPLPTATRGSQTTSATPAAAVSPTPEPSLSVASPSPSPSPTVVPPSPTPGSTPSPSLSPEPSPEPTPSPSPTQDPPGRPPKKPHPHAEPSVTP